MLCFYPFKGCISQEKKPKSTKIYTWRAKIKAPAGRMLCMPGLNVFVNWILVNRGGRSRKGVKYLSFRTKKHDKKGGGRVSKYVINGWKTSFCVHLNVGACRWQLTFGWPVAGNIVICLLKIIQLAVVIRGPGIHSFDYDRKRGKQQIMSEIL